MGLLTTYCARCGVSFGGMRTNYHGQLKPLKWHVGNWRKYSFCKDCARDVTLGGEPAMRELALRLRQNPYPWKG